MAITFISALPSLNSDFLPGLSPKQSRKTRILSSQPPAHALSASSSTSKSVVREQDVASSTTKWVSGLVLGALIARRGTACRSRQKHFNVSCQSASAGLDTSILEKAPPPLVEETLAEAFKACLKGLDDDAEAASSQTSSRIRWSVEAEEENSTGQALYSRFRIDGVPARQARSLGNTLRRTLLRQDLFRCHAAVAFRLHSRMVNRSKEDFMKVFVSRAEPALHEFASVPAVHESMIDVVRNVQRLAVAKAPQEVYNNRNLPLSSLASGNADGEPETWRWALRRCGPCTVQAGDLDIVDGSTHYEMPLVLPVPQQHLLRITVPTMVELEVEATCCSQYEWETSPAFDTYKHRLRADGWLMVPPIFSPIRKVNYLISESKSSESAEPSETVQLELWTTKSARQPREFVLTAAATLLARLAARADRAGEATIDSYFPSHQIAQVEEEQQQEQATPKDTPELPSLPGLPELPNLPELSKATPKDTPKLPELPGLPELPNLPELSKATPKDTPKLPELPGLPELPNLPELSKATPKDTPKLPELPGLPELPNLPELSKAEPLAQEEEEEEEEQHEEEEVVEPVLEETSQTEQVLPEGWQAVWSEQENQYYYWNEVTDHVQWEVPVETTDSTSDADDLASDVMRTNGFSELVGSISEGLQDEVQTGLGKGIDDLTKGMGR
eukprot:TRINITY_DN4225_c0_g1_i2.p1 TRINITY_DN4225_c0_g1~~TRINITY_DN4225_c0_g1_i2.p1  ORF type:complete len:675 (+),score=102.82 TRINITY_DN4225_c0_g1_i2:44-2068(+)